MTDPAPEAARPDPAALPEESALPDESTRQTETARARWLDPTWRSAALGWVEDHLARLGLAITGPVEQPHLRPWSTALSIPTRDGLVWFKAGGPGNRYEAALLGALARWRTPYLLEPLAVDTERGWLLLPDGGARLRETLGGGPGVDAWVRILPEWAQLQIELAPRADELASLGVPDLRRHHLPVRLAEVLEDASVEVLPEDRRRLHDVLPIVEAWSEELAAVGVAPSLQHDDLHDGNVFVGPAGDRFFDWGDASVSHPFGTLLVTFRSIASRGLGAAEERARALSRLQDAYLEPWTVSHTRAQLDVAVPLAMRLAIIGRALSWHRALAGIPPHDQGEWSGNVTGWLMDLFESDLV